MTIDEIRAGESKTLEFKAARPQKSLQYMKTVVAFSNGLGGRLVFGVDDKTRKIVGIPEEIVFEEMDAIANAVADSCEPAVFPNIYLQTLEEKTVIVVDVPSGRQRPYYIKAAGRDQGTYLRLGATSRQVDDEILLELLFEGKNRFYDKTICLGEPVSEDEIQIFCAELKKVAIRYARSEEQKAATRDVTKQQLLSWGILTVRDGQIYPTNAYEILTGKNGRAIQCGVFKGETKAIFVDRRQYEGYLWEQLEEAFQFVLRNIRMGATFHGLYRVDVYEIPPDSIRELITNAVVHRSYINRNNIQVAIYDNRLEIVSPGRLPAGQTLEGMKQGMSLVRNEALAKAFYYMNLIEHWGSGMLRVSRELMDAGLGEMEILEKDMAIVTSVYRNTEYTTSSIEEIGIGNRTYTEQISETPSEYSRIIIGKESKNHRKTDEKPSEKKPKTIGKESKNHRKTDTTPSELKKTQKTIVQLLSEDGHQTAAELAQKIGISSRNIEANMKTLKAAGLLVRHGSRKDGYWEVTAHR